MRLLSTETASILTGHDVFTSEQYLLLGRYSEAPPTVPDTL